MPLKTQKPCPVCGHFSNEYVLECPCICHGPFRIKAITTKKERKVYKD